jgi:hypothetical protein
MSRRSRRLTGAAVVAALGAATAGGVIAQADQSAPSAKVAAAGGVGVTPSILQHVAKRGNVGTVTIENTTKDFLIMTVTVRPWKQGANGVVSADMKHTLSTYVRPDVASFNLAPGSKKPISMILRKIPKSGSLYGAISIFGKPKNAKNRNGIIAQYQLNSSMRLDPARKHFNLKIGNTLYVAKSVLVGVRNNGNTVDPIGGTVTIKGKTSTVGQVRIVPGHVVNVRLASIAGTGIKPGVYPAQIKLTQSGKTFSVTRNFRVK